MQMLMHLTLQVTYQQPCSRNLLVLSPGRLPTTDYYLTVRQQHTPELTWTYLDALAPSVFEELDHVEPGSLVVLVRQVPRSVLRKLHDLRCKLGGVVWLVDDDIPGVLTCRELPLGYRLRTGFRYWWQRPLLEKLCNRIWVATPALQQRYPSVPTSVLPPLPYLVDREHGEREAVWFYHGTASHRSELEWLVPIVKRVQAACPDMVFEVSGSKSVAQLFSGIPRVRLLPPTDWPDFLAYTSRSSYLLGVAPLLPSRFNVVRSHTKFFDITRCGAVGLFSDRPPYRSALPAGGAVLLPDDQQVWAAAIIDLLMDDKRRMELFTTAVSWCRQQQGGLPL
jgi:hypothetical protein